jgi:hypothetical protein
VKKEYKWSVIKSVEIKKNGLELKNKIGSIRKINLPVNSNKQLEKLGNYLKQIAESKKINYKRELDSKLIGRKKDN